MSYRMNNEELDALIHELVVKAAGPDAGPEKDTDLVGEIVVTALKLLRDETDRGEIKMMNTALKELRYSSLVFDAYRDRPKVAVYGSARTEPDDPNYVLATEFSRRMADEERWMVITGAGPGIMEAANRGAGTDASFGVNIRLPFENGANEYLSPGKVINFKYFFTRKVQFVKESDAFALFPGGWGTMDETFELLTLIQTGKSDMHPIVMVEAEGTGYWKPWELLCDALLDQGMISPADRNLYRVTTDLDEAIEEIVTFFRVYHSQRFVDKQLVLRLQRDIPDAFVAELADEFADIIVSGTITKIDATDAEVATADHLGRPRIAFEFDRKSYGRLRALIDRINEAPPETPV
ncbi:MAG: TIGR00730 family Rossman fold protein [Acidimicrobiia bacterium]|nr:TIGR00730 family Rossman fold protein [Acidimicrobiia bacterium]